MYDCFEIKYKTGKIGLTREIQKHGQNEACFFQNFLELI
jgi:hypothetical protein